MLRYVIWISLIFLLQLYGFTGISAQTVSEPNDKVYNVQDVNKVKYNNYAKSALGNFYELLVNCLEQVMKDNFIQRMMHPASMLAPDFYYKSKMTPSYMSPTQYIMEFEKEYVEQLEHPDELFIEISNEIFDTQLCNPENDEHAAYLKVIYDLHIVYKEKTFKKTMLCSLLFSSTGRFHHLCHKTSYAS